MSYSDKDQSHVIGGLKATISNPNTSTEAKEHAAERLEELGQPRYTSPSREHTHELGTHQIAGYKATISNPNTSDEAKEHAREVLKAEGEEIPQPGHPPPASTQDPHTKRVLAGYKAAIHNPNVSEQAKSNAKEKLKEFKEPY